MKKKNLQPNNIQHFPINKLRSKLILNILIPNFTSISFEWTTTFGRLTTENLYIFFSYTSTYTSNCQYGRRKLK